MELTLYGVHANDDIFPRNRGPGGGGGVCIFRVGIVLPHDILLP